MENEEKEGAAPYCKKGEGVKSNVVSAAAQRSSGGQVGGPALGITPLKKASRLKSDSFVQHVQPNSHAGKYPVLLAALKTIIVDLQRNCPICTKQF